MTSFLFGIISSEIFVPNLVSLTRLSLQIFGKTQIGVFPISGFLVKKLTTETKIDKRKLRKETRQPKKMDDDVISGNCNVIVISPIYGQLAAIRMPDSERTACKTYIFINSSNLLSYKN